jgi:KDO2-lipid IV(A) lauroyltransferase
MISGAGRDLREGGRWSVGQQAKNDLLYAGARAALAIAELLPASWLRRLGQGVGIAAWAVLPGLRRLAEDNVARGLPAIAPAERRAFVRRVYRRLGALLGETVLPAEPLPFAPGARACLADALAEGRGVLFASAHLGPFERVAATIAAAGFPLTVVAREPYDPRLGRIYDKVRAARGVHALYRGRAGAAMEMFRVLRRGGVLGVPMDLASRVPSIDVPFLGSPAPTPLGPARLALRAGAAVVVGGACNLPPPETGPETGEERRPVTGKPTDQPNQIGVSFRRIDVAPDASERTLTEALNEELSARIRALPEAWPWMHRRWPEA